MRGYTIYSFADPRTSEVRYIGATTHTAAIRLAQIKYGKRARNQFPEVGAWILELEALGLSPVLSVLERNTSDGIDGEKRWIAIFRAAGASLFNKSDGGRGTNGVKHTEEWKLNNSRILTGRKRTEETKAKIAASKVGKPRPDLAERNKSQRRLTMEQAEAIRNNTLATARDLAKEYGVSPAMICLIQKGLRYKS